MVPERSWPADRCQLAILEMLYCLSHCLASSHRIHGNANRFQGIVGVRIKSTTDGGLSTLISNVLSRLRARSARSTRTGVGICLPLQGIYIYKDKVSGVPKAWSMAKFGKVAVRIIFMA